VARGGHPSKKEPRTKEQTLRNPRRVGKNQVIKTRKDKHL